jgi:hypothetical protein
MEIEGWKAQLERERREKNRFFGEHWQSPIPPQDRGSLEDWTTTFLTRITDSRSNFTSMRRRRW